MQNSSEMVMVQDTSTQAMTEVALGLSMAFFALLIIALMSVSLPPSTNNSGQALSSIQTNSVDISKQINVSIEDKKNVHSSTDSTNSSDEIILLYWQGQFFDTQQQAVNIKNFASQKSVIVAVNPQIPFNQLIDIQTQFAGNTLRLAKLSDQWQLALSKNSAANFLPNKHSLNKN